MSFSFPNEPIDFILRANTLLFFVITMAYWRFSEISTEKEKPKTKRQDRFLSKTVVMWFGYRVVTSFVLLQVIGLHILPMQGTIVMQITGFSISLVGIGVAKSARRILGTNWTHAREYQVKKKQELITAGIYKYLRHPIYIGFTLYFIGAELVAKSWLVVPMTVIAFAFAYAQGKREEKLLLSHYGKEYRQYMRRSKMLIPFVW